MNYYLNFHCFLLEYTISLRIGTRTFQLIEEEITYVRKITIFSFKFHILIEKNAEFQSECAECFSIDMRRKYSIAHQKARILDIV